MKILKILKKVSLYSTILFIIGIFSLYLFLENGAKFYYPEKDRLELVQRIKSSPPLPDNFVEFYNIIYPNNQNYTTWGFLKKQFSSLNPNRDLECFSLTLTRRFSIPYKNSNRLMSALKPIMVSLYVEDFVTQKVCFDYLCNNFNFTNNQKGVKAVSQNLFKKPLKDLEPLEMSEILALMQNPIRYDRFRNPEKAKQRTNYILKKYKNNITLNSEIH